MKALSFIPITPKNSPDANFKAPAVPYKRFAGSGSSEKDRKHIFELGHNKGVLCGQPSRGLFVIDIDDKKALPKWKKKLSEINIDIDKTLVVSTPHGYHIYLRSPYGSPTVINSKFEDGDVKGQNGYVVAPGTSWQGAEYIASDHIEILRLDNVQFNALSKLISLRTTTQVYRNISYDTWMKFFVDGGENAEIADRSTGELKSPDRSTLATIQATILVRSGWSDGEIIDWLERNNEKVNFRGKQYAASHILSQAKATISAERSTISDITTSLLSYSDEKLSGRSAKTDSILVKAHTNKAHSFGVLDSNSITYSYSFIDMALDTGLGMKTVERAMKRLKGLGLVEVAQSNRSTLATKYRITKKKCGKVMKQSKEPRCVPVTSVYHTHDVFLGLPGRSRKAIFDLLLSKKAANIKYIIDNANLAEKTVRKHLKLMLDIGLIKLENKLYFVPEEVNLDYAAKCLGVSGKAEKKRAQFEKRRADWRAWLKKRSQEHQEERERKEEEAKQLDPMSKTYTRKGCETKKSTFGRGERYKKKKKAGVKT